MALPTDTAYGIGADAFTARRWMVYCPPRAGVARCPLPVLVALHGLAADSSQQCWALVEAF